MAPTFLKSLWGAVVVAGWAVLLMAAAGAQAQTWAPAPWLEDLAQAKAAEPLLA
jgi:hypothetical protein